MKIHFTLILVAWSSMTFAQIVNSSFTANKKSITLATGITIKYIESGNKDGSPLILLHGVTDTSRSFQSLIEELNKFDNKLRIIAPDLRGHGDSSMPNEPVCAGHPEKCFTYEQFAEDIIDLMDQLKISKADIVGHSMGSLITQTLALNHPDRVNSITLISTLVDGKQNSMIQDVLIHDMLERTWKPILLARQDLVWPADAYLKTPGELGEGVKTFLKENWVTEACADQHFVDSVFPETMSIRLGTWIGALHTLGETDNREALKNLKVPALVLWASQDCMFIERDQQLVKAALKSAAHNNQIKATFKTYGKQPLPEGGYPLTEVGHNLHWGAPKHVAEDIVSFIRKGFPVKNLPYANPDNIKEIRAELTDVGVEVFK